MCCEAEPIYRPASKNHPHHRIVFANDFYASALHEIAHWCVAGKERRLLEDFGYWYNPDGRDASQQAEFEKVEIKPQAYEWVFSQAAEFKFHFSADNLLSDCGASEEFKLAVQSQVFSWIETELPCRAKLFKEALNEFYNTPKNSPKTDFLFKTLIM